MEETAVTAGRGRTLDVRGRGATADALELDALDQARQFFGADAQLSVDRDYMASCDMTAPPEQRFNATIRVREVGSPSGR